jgi:hypothetical protein
MFLTGSAESERLLEFSFQCSSFKVFLKAFEDIKSIRFLLYIWHVQRQFIYRLSHHCADNQQAIWYRFIAIMFCDFRNVF